MYQLEGPRCDIALLCLVTAGRCDIALLQCYVTWYVTSGRCDATLLYNMLCNTLRLPLLVYMKKLRKSGFISRRRVASVL